MREILFRGKRLDNGEWIYGYYLYSEKYNKHYIVDERITTTLEGKLVPQESGFIKKEAIPETVVQYTGLTDKNGKRIFEGDKINIEFPNTLVTDAIVEYIGASFYGSTNADTWELDYYYKIEVIGNIFDKEDKDE